jgi:hypothetical protein
VTSKIQPRPYRELPRPARIAAEELTPFFNGQLVPLIMPVRDLPVNHIVESILKDERIGPIMSQGMNREGGPHGTLFMVSEVLFGAVAHQVYEIAPELVKLLMHTDFSSDNPVPAHYCRLPGTDPIFVHVPQPPAELDVPSPVDVLPLCGYYLREVAMPGGRMIEVIAVSQPPPGNQTTSADNFIFSDIPIVDEQRGLHESFEEADQHARLSLGKVDAPHLRAQMRPHIDFLVKLLCYLGMREVRREVHADRTQAISGLDNLGPKKRDAALSRARKLYDYVRIAPPADSDSDSDGSDSARSVAAHHRRGHLRLAHVGQGRQERRVVWVRPTIVGLPAAATKTVHYRVS